jgi:hypothetical protein
VWDPTLVDYVITFGLEGVCPHDGASVSYLGFDSLKGMSLPESIGFVGLGDMGAPVMFTLELFERTHLI